MEAKKKFLKNIELKFEAPYCVYVKFFPLRKLCYTFHVCMHAYMSVCMHVSLCVWYLLNIVSANGAKSIVNISLWHKCP